MIVGGVTLLVSYGLAAGLDPRFGPGALLLPETVIATRGRSKRPIAAVCATSSSG